MASILDLLTTSKGEDIISRTGEKTLEPKEKVTAILGMALPVILGAMQVSVDSREGQESLNEALQDAKYGDKFLAELNKKASEEIISQGDKILNHVLGKHQNDIISNISNVAKIEESAVADIMKLAAPLLMSILSSIKRKEKIDSEDLGKLLQSVMGASVKYDSALIEAFLDKNNDANILDDVKGMVLGGEKKGKNDGGILGGMTGGK